jgi:hypothetical protein
MTTAERTLSYDTVTFVDRWLFREFPVEHHGEHYCTRLREAMLRVIASDEPWWITRNLWCAYDEALKHIELSQ